MRRCFPLLFFCCIATLLPGISLAADAGHETGQGPSTPAPQAIQWQTLQNGLALAQIPLPVAHPVSVPFPGTPPHTADPASLQHNATQPAQTPLMDNAQQLPVVTVLRIDPQYFTFTLHMASGDKARSLPDLAQMYGLAAAINASMYLPDNITSTGHLRNATHVNNPRVVEKFGAFLVAQPKDPKLPRAALLDRVEDDWQKALGQYSLVVQNYRLNNAQGKVLWSPEGPPHSIAALSQDKLGNIIFLLCREPVQPAAFATALLHLPLGLRTIMYLEGGPQAAMLVRSGSVDQVWVGRHISGLWGTSGHQDAVLPNVLGIRPRATGE